jgi:hypothetical protein
LKCAFWQLPDFSGAAEGGDINDFALRINEVTATIISVDINLGLILGITLGLAIAICGIWLNIWLVKIELKQELS